MKFSEPGLKFLTNLGANYAKSRAEEHALVGRPAFSDSEAEKAFLVEILMGLSSTRGVNFTEPEFEELITFADQIDSTNPIRKPAPAATDSTTGI